MSLTLKVKFSNGTVRAMRFTLEMSVSEACHQIAEKAGDGQGGVDHGLFLPAVEGKYAAKWLRDEKTLQFYDLQTDVLVEYRKKHHARKVRLLDDTVKTILLDESTTVTECVESIAKKMGIKNPEEFSLQRSDGGDWLKGTSVLGELGLPDDEVLVLKKKFFFNDANIDRNDPVQLHLLFVQCRDNVIESNYPTTKDEARDLAAIQCQVQFGDHTANRVQGSSWINLKEFLPTQWVKVKGIDKEIAKEYRKLVGMSEVNAKYRYVQLCRSLKTYGMTSFNVKTKDPIKKNKLKDLTIGVTRESVIFMDFETKEVTKSYKLTQIKRWAAADKSFTFDLGDYEPDYLTVYTNNSEQIAQLISGYIEIILKTRRETGRVVKDNDNNVATEERVTLNRGSAAHSVTTSVSGSYGGAQGSQYSGGAGNMSSQYVPASSKVAITDLAAAVRATDMLLAELEASGSAPKPTGAVTTLTPQQYRQQLMMNAQQAALMANSMLNDFNNPPPGGIQALRTQLTTKAQQIMSCMSIVGKNAQNAAYVNEVSDQSMDIMDASNKLASAIAKMMKLTSNAADGDQTANEALRQAAFYASAVGLLMSSACEEGRASLASKLLLEECAKSVAVCGKLLFDLSEENAPMVDTHLMADVNASVTSFRDANEQLVITTETLAPVSAHPESAKRILELAEESIKHANALSTNFRKCSTLGPDILNSVAVRAQDLLAAIDLLTKCVECVDPGQTEEPAGGDLSEEFTAAQSNLTQAYASLRAGSGDPAQLQDAIKGISSSTNRLVACCRGVAAKADGATQNRLLIAAKASLDAVQNLAAACRTALQNPGDADALAKVFDAAGYLQNVNQQMIADAGKIASVASLCDSAKHMVAMVASLASSVRQSVAELPEPLAAPALKNARDVTEAVPKLVAAIKRIVQNPTSDKAQVELLDIAQRTALPPMNLVSAAKRVSPKVSEMNLKQKLLLSADGTAQAVQKLMAACQTFKQIGGHVEIEEALEAFAATIADLETAEIASQGGFLETMPGQTRENTVELLTIAIKSTNEANQALFDTAKTNPSQLGEAVKASTNAASQVAVAAKGVASTTPGKAAQKKILATAKAFSSQMETLVRSSRTLASNPNDPSADLLMDSSMQDVSATLANLIGSSVQIDSRDLDESAAQVLAESQKLGVLNAKNPGNFQSSAEDLESSIKALNAAVLQVIGMARAKNLKGLGAAARITASTIPTLIGAANNTAASSDSEATQENIIASAATLAQNVIALFDFAKARVVNTKDPVYDLNLTQANKNISDSSTKLLRSLGSAANKDCEDAIDAIMDAIHLLESASLQELATLAGSSPDTLVQTHQAGLQSLSAAARELGGTSSNIVTAASTSPEKLGESSKSAAASIVTLVNAANRVFCANACQVPHSVFIPAKNILDSGAILVTSGGNIPQIINSARTVSTATQQLLQAAKERAMAIEDPTVQEKLLQSSQKLANATASLAKAAKALAAKQPDGQSLTVAAVKDLEAATKALLLSASYTAEQGITVDTFDRLLGAARALAASSSTLISTSMSVSSKPKDSQLQANLSDSAGALTAAIRDILKASASMMPGVVECEEAVEVAQKASGELTSATLAIAVGSFDTSIGKGVPHQKTQEDLVEVAKNIGTGILHLANASRQSPEAIGKSAREVANLLPQLVAAAKVAVATTNDQDEQNKIIETSKMLVDAILRACQASTKASSNPSKETYQDVLKSVEESEAAINQLVGTLASGVNLLRDLDDAIDRINKSAAQLVQPGNAPEGVSYQESKDELNSTSKALAVLMRNVVAADKANLVQVGTASKEIAKQMPIVIDVACKTMVLANDEGIKDQIRTAAKELVNSTAAIVKCSKAAAAEPGVSKHQQDIANNFKGATSAITQLLAAAKRGAVGEIMSDGAVDQISRAISDLEAFSLFAAAGQLENEGTQSQVSAAVAQKELFNASKALIVAASQLVGSTKGSQEQLGAAAGGVSATVLKVVKQSEDVAGTLNETGLQQAVLSACKAVGIATQQLVLAGKDAQRFKKDPTASRSLSKAAEALAEAVGQLVGQVHTSYAEAQKGFRELEKSHTTIAKMLAEIESLTGNDDASAVDVAASARAVAEASASVVTSANVSQDELVKAAIKLSGASAAMLRNAKGATRLLTDDAAKQKLLERAKNITGAILKLIDSVKDQTGDHSAIISEASELVASGISDLVKFSRTLPGGQTIQLEEAEIEDTAGEDLEEVAERELVAAAKQIEAAAAALLASKPAPKPKAPGVVLDQSDIAGTIVDASSTIAQAVAKLVHAAAVAQSKRRQQRATSGRTYKKDPVWSNGLISAARAVAEATGSLVGSANKAVQGQAEEEELIATARAVAAATAQLVAASRAKSGDDPEGQKSHATLSTAAKAVANATSQLVAAAKAATAFQEQEADSKAEEEYNFTGSRVKDLEQQMKILKLEKELDTARRQMLNSRKQQYK